METTETIAGLAPNIQVPAQSILDQLNGGGEPLATRSQLIRGKGRRAAFEALLEAKVLVAAGKRGRSEYFAVNRGADTFTVAKLEAEELSKHKQALLEALGKVPRWTAKNALLGAKPSASRKNAYKALIADGNAVEVGTLKRVQYVAPTHDRSATQTLTALAAEVVFQQIIPGKIKAFPLESGKKPWPQVMPPRVRQFFAPALKGLLAAGQAVRLEESGKGLFVLSVNAKDVIDSALGERTANGLSNAARPTPDAELARVVRAAYRRLVQREGDEHVLIADLCNAAQVPLQELKNWLLEECEVQRAEPAIGEPALATEAQRAAALSIQGKLHLYIRLEQV